MPFQPETLAEFDQIVRHEAVEVPVEAGAFGGLVWSLCEPLVAPKAMVLALTATMVWP